MERVLLYASDFFSSAAILASFIIATLILIILIRRSVILVRQAEVVIVERFGRYHRLLQPGLHMIVPFIDNLRTIVWTHIQEVEGKKHHYRYTQVMDRIDLREAVYDFPRQNVITRDNVTMEINALIYYQITDPKAAMYEVFNLSEAIEKITQTTLRNVIGSMDLDETLVSRDAINERLRIILDDATDKWGVKINRVELQEVNPPADIRHAMEKQMRAERERRETILRSEGLKSAAILEAEGEKESQVLRAQGEAESNIIRAQGQATARTKMAEAEAETLRLIRDANPTQDPTPYLIAIQYVNSLSKLAESAQGKLMVLPYEATALMGSVAGIKEIFKTEAEKTKNK